MSDQEKLVAGEELDSAQEAQPDQADEAAGDAATDPDALHALLEDARNKADTHWDQCLRLQADIENLRKRNERDLVNAHKFALEKFVVDLLPVKDSLEMGLAAAGENADVAKLKEGGELTLKMLTSVIDKYNIKEVKALNKQFNPEYHEAMSMQERADVEPNTVVTVVQKGYLLNDRLIRPAMVIVSKAAPEVSGGQLNEQA
ncbi:MAG: nucleotide exchange factor GrpE [Pseudomonadota bacterium]|nr:nucleotide exchange factor GrpE [Pseudomonadota bacterium]